MRFYVPIRFLVVTSLFTLAGTNAWSQTPRSAISNPLMRMIAAQPAIDTKSPVVPTASFDPPEVRPGERAVYRITLNAIESSVRLPDRMPAPDGLKFRQSAHGQIYQNVTNVLKPSTTFLFDVSADRPGRYIVPAFVVAVYGEPVVVPETKLRVVAELPKSHQPARQLILECDSTNVFVGQQVEVRVLSPSRGSNLVQTLTQVELNGDDFLASKNTARQMIETIERNGRRVPTYIYETTMTPIAPGQMTLSAQGFTAGRLFGPITIRAGAVIPGSVPQHLLLDSEPITFNVRPLPTEGALPGFTGAIGHFDFDPPHLATNTIRVGDPVRLTVTIRGTGDLSRLTPPPAPSTKAWQVFPATSAGFVGGRARTAPGAVFDYTLIPLTDEARQTPAIPFSFFDPERAAYVDRTIPPVPVVVVANGLPTTMPAALQLPNDESQPEKKPTLSGLASSPGHLVGSFVPLPLRGWFLVLQLLPALGFAGLWSWDQRRRHLALHPEIVRRRAARRQLRRQKRMLKRAASEGDASGYARSSVAAMQIVCAPHYLAEPRALVCGDVLNVLAAPERQGRAGEVVRQFFTAADSSRFALSARTPVEVFALQSELDRVLAKLEERL